MSSAKERKKARELERKRRAEAERNLGFKVVWVLLNSGGLGFVAALLLLLIVRLGAYAGLEVNEDILQLWLFTVFIVFFFVTFIVLIRKHLPAHWFEEKPKKEEEGWEPPSVKFDGLLEPKEDTFESIFKNARSAGTPIALEEPQEGEDQGSFSGEDYVSEPIPEDDESGHLLDEVDDGDGLEDADPVEIIDETPPETAQADEEEAPSEPEPSKPDPNKIDDDTSENAAAFVTTAMEAVKASKKKLDAFSKFGLNLYLSGGCGHLIRKASLDAGQGQSLLKSMIVQTGANKSAADSFTQNVDEYSQRPRYRKMIDAGKRAMESCVFGQNGYNDGLPALLEEWSLPENRTGTPKIVTFMFTDIVDSTALTEKVGNIMAQRVIRAHNTIVRKALRSKEGTEVKHTGDGIMATFQEPQHSVKAAIEIQQELEAYNRKHQDLQVKVRIGLNAGEAVIEENDYFGTAVQLTARICDNAKSSEVRCSEVIYQACSSDKELFESKGEVDLKGIARSQKIFLINWPRMLAEASPKGVTYGQIGKTDEEKESA